MGQDEMTCSGCGYRFESSRRYCRTCGNDSEDPLAGEVAGVPELNAAFSASRGGEAADYRAALPFFAEAVNHIDSLPQPVAVMALYEYVLSFYRSNYRSDGMSSLRRADMTVAAQAAEDGRRLLAKLPPEVRGELGSIVGRIFDDALKEAGRSSATSAAAPAAKQSGCFIATAVFGSYDADEVRALREFRDRVLLRSALGARLTGIYYEVSPALVPHIRNRPMVRASLRAALRLVVGVVDPRNRNAQRDRTRRQSDQ